MTKLQLKKGDKILLNFLLPPQGTITDLPGQVVNVNLQQGDDYILGVKFYPDEQHKELIGRFKSIVDEIKNMTGIRSF